MEAGAARLIDTPQAPAPAGGRAEVFAGAGGAPLRAALWTPPGAAAGSVILSPGRTEPIEKYFEVIGELLERGYVVLAHDWRGQGLSHRLLPDRLRGYAEDWRDFVDDQKALLAAFHDRLPRPRIALAHSMGACLAALALPQERRLDAAVFTAPMFGIALGPLPGRAAAAVAAALCRLGSRAAYAPRAGHDPIADPFDPANILTSDRARWERHRAQLRACPELALGGVTWGWLDAAFRAAAEALKPALGRAIDIPVLLLLAGDERLVVNTAARRFAANVPGARVVEIPGSRHEILMETDSIRAVFWKEFDALAAVLESGRSGPR